MAIKGSVREKKKETEKKIESLVNTIAGRMDDTLEADALRELIDPSTMETTRKGHTIWFDETHRHKFKELANLFSELGVKAAVSYDDLSEMWTFCVGKHAEGKEAAGTKPEFIEKKEEIVQKAAAAMITPSPVEKAKKSAPAEEEKKAAPAPVLKKPKKLTKKEKKVMEQLNKVVEGAKDIYKYQYKLGEDALKGFLADYAKLQNMLTAKKGISDYTHSRVELMLRAANVEFWKGHAEKRLAPATKKAEEMEIPLRGKPAEAAQALSEEAMAWVGKQYRKKTGQSYDALLESYNKLKEEFDSTENLSSKLRSAQQIADSTRASHKAIASLEKQFKKKFPDEAVAFDALLARVDSAANSASIAARPTMEQLYAWAGEGAVAKRYLDVNKEAIEKMLPMVSGTEIAKVLEYIDAAVKSELEGTKNPRPRPRVILDRGADFPAVRNGLQVLYAAKGLQYPLYKKTKAERKSLKGKYIMVDVSAPELFVKPKKTDILPPADKDGNVFVKYKGRKIYLHPGQKEVIERSLRDGSIGYVEVTKFGKKTTQVDAAGADLLAQYLHEKGWTNIELIPWIRGPARAGLRVLETPEGYWDRPVARKAEVEVVAKEVRDKRAKERMDDETFKMGVFEIREPKSERFGRVLDKPAERSRFEVDRQKAGLESLVNNPAAEGAIFFENVGAARNAARMLRTELLGRNDLRAVSIQVLRDYIGQVEGAYLTISTLPADAFMERSKTPLAVPVAYEGKTVLTTAEQRLALQDFLNGETKKKELSIRTGKDGAEALAAYLTRIGYPMENFSSGKMLDVEVAALSEAERLTAGAEVWEIKLRAVEIPPAPKEEGESVAVRGIKGGGKLKKGRAREYYGSDSYRMRLRRNYEDSEHWLKARLDAEAAAKGEKRNYFVSHGLQDASDVYETYSQDYNRMSADQRLYTAFATGGQGFAYTALGSDRARIFWQNDIATTHLTDSHVEARPEGARYSQDVQSEVVAHMLYMHTGPGKMDRDRFKKEHYPERSAQMLAVLSKYRNIDEFADALGNHYAAAAIYDAASHLTDEALALDLGYMTLPPSEQAKKREATFDMMWRSYVSLIAFETGQHPSTNPDQKQLDACAGALVDYIAGRGEGVNTFTIRGHEYKTAEVIVVRFNGKNVLAVPYIDESGAIDPTRMHIIGTRTLRTKKPEGYTYYENKLETDEKKLEKIFTSPRLKSDRRSAVDSMGPVGLTFRYVWGTNPPELNITEKEKPPIPNLTPVYPEYYGEHGYVAVANDLYWERLGVSFDSPKETVMPQLDNGVLLLHTVSGEMMAEDSKFYIHPPRTRFKADGTEDELVEDYPTFKTYAYSSAYIDFDNGDAVYLFREAGDKVESPKFRPANAREYAEMSDAQLKKKGVFKIKVGTFDRFTHSIKYREGMKEQFDKYIMGSWAANEQDLREMNDEDKKAMVSEVEENRHYYVVETSHTATPAKEEMEVGSAEDIGVTGRMKEKAGLYLSGNAPDVLIVWEKKEEK